MSDNAGTFDPSKYLRKVSGADYLEVKFRLLWFRTNHPNGIIETELIYRDDKQAIFKATVEIPLEGGEGGGRASGYGSETQGDFRDFLEKAETKAIGRALGALGFGTQFSFDHDDGAVKDRPVDAPVQRQDAPARNRSTSRNTAGNLSGSPQTHETGAQVSEQPVNVQRASQGQLNVIAKHLGDLGWGDAEESLLVQSKNKAALAEFTTDEAAKLIQFLAKPETAQSWLNTMKPAQAEMLPDTARKARA